VDTTSGTKSTQHTDSQGEGSIILFGLIWLEMFCLLYFWFPSHHLSPETEAQIMSKTALDKGENDI